MPFRALSSKGKKHPCLKPMTTSRAAKAFSTTPGDPERDVCADLDDNEIINTIDFAKVARDLGETV